MIIFLIIGLLLGAVAVVFVLQNITTVTVAFLGWQIEGSLALILFLAVVCGILIALLLSLPRSIRRSLQISRLKKENSRLKDQVVHKSTEVEVEKAKVEANNVYLDEMEKTP